MAMTANRSITDRAQPVKSVALGDDVFLVEYGQESLVYAPLARLAFFVPLTIAVLQRQLTSNRLLRPFTIGQEARLVRSRLKSIRPSAAKPPMVYTACPPRPTGVTLFLTTACNLRCRYCYAAAGSRRPREMPLSIARKAVQFVVGNVRAIGAQMVDVAFHGGGEPTLAWDTLVKTHEFASETAHAYGIRVNTMIATNGALSEQKTAWIIEHASSASVSFDGLPDSHDRNRPLFTGTGSFKHVLRTIDAFERERFTYGLRLTVTNEDIGRIADSVRFICQRFRPFSIVVEPAYQLGRWYGAGSTDVRHFISEFRYALMVAREYGLAISFSAARFPTISDRFCGATWNNFCVTPAGQVSACYMALDAEGPLGSHFIYGRFDSRGKAFRFDRPVLEALRCQSANGRLSCRDCFARWHCAGDCLYQVLTSQKLGSRMHADRCSIVQELTKDAIVETVLCSPEGVWNGRGASVLAPRTGHWSPNGETPSGSLLRWVTSIFGTASIHSGKRQ